MGNASTLEPGITPAHAGNTGEAGVHVHVQRITPAHAGNTLLELLKGLPHMDHPRACGEYMPAMRPNWRRAGSPPRMRGILLNIASPKI